MTTHLISYELEPVDPIESLLALGRLPILRLAIRVPVQVSANGQAMPLKQLATGTNQVTQCIEVLLVSGQRTPVKESKTVEHLFKQHPYFRRHCLPVEYRRPYQIA